MSASGPSGPLVPFFCSGPFLEAIKFPKIIQRIAIFYLQTRGWAIIKTWAIIKDKYDIIYWCTFKVPLRHYFENRIEVIQMNAAFSTTYEYIIYALLMDKAFDALLISTSLRHY